MQMRVSEIGDMVISCALIEQLGIRPGDPMDATFEAGRIAFAFESNVQY